MIDLSSFEGKTVVVQLRAPDAWITIHQEQGKPAILAIDDGSGGHRLIQTPFVIGKVVKTSSGKHAILFVDENNKKLELSLNPEAILAVTEAIEPSKIELIAV